MCGICGQVNQDPARPIDENVLRSMNQQMVHRGPDSDGFYVKRNVGLAMRRLAIIDLDTGQQPIANEDQTVWVVCNGEIYNFQELRQELESKGHVFKTKSDTEVIVHLYEEEGTDCIKRLRGMFGLAIWDEKEEQLLIARDRLGKKPLYYAQTSDALVFASELKCLLKSPDVKQSLNFEAIHHYLTLQYVPDPLSAFEGIMKLPPAHQLIYKNQQIKIEPYWQLDYEPKLRGSEESLSQELIERLKEAIRIRFVSDVPLGAHLSGGIDSSIIVALATQLSPDPVKTFSIGFEEETFSELKYARAVADKYQTEHHEFVVKYGDVPQLIDKLVGYFDEPFADPSAVPVYYLSEMTRKHVTVALNGDGGDELFAGYFRYRVDSYADIYAKFPRFITQGIVPAILNIFPHPVNVPGETSPIVGLKRLAQVARTTSKANFIRWGSYFHDEVKGNLWKSDYYERVKAKETIEFLSSFYDQTNAKTKLDKTLFVDTMTYLPGDLLVKADRMTMAHSLEGRSPFLDQEFVSWVLRLPEQFKLSGKVHKYLLKKACYDLFPKELIHRGKRGFGIPLGAWFREPLKDWSRECLLDSKSQVLNFFNRSEIEKLLVEHQKGRTNHGNRLWALVMLERWLAKYQPTHR